MSAKLEKIGAEREKALKKRDEWDARFKELDRKYKAQENVEIQETVHSYNLTPGQLAELLKQLGNGKILDIQLPADQEGNETAEKQKYTDVQEDTEIMSREEDPYESEE